MTEFLAMVVDMITKSLKEHGLFKTCFILMGMIGVLILLVLAFKMDAIILAIKA